MGECDHPKNLSWSLWSGQGVALLALSAMTVVSLAIVIALSSGMTAGRVIFSLKLMQVTDIQLEIEKPTSENMK